LDDVVSESTKWAQATRSNVRKYLSLLYPYINYSDGLNVWIARALSCYPEVRHETIPLIEDAIEIEKNEDVKKWLGESLNKLMS
jgi:hypothetical protein